ncbi:hypothetical protein M409DRAFT_68903 [Zasmidium cellare ATCC 36951]|uniref:GRAM domain-containing protein n=1 Tax=Zasmidium cellare ATCC 36951 TaxID=1080233 RepID=A0A6A6CBD8_ZASCE|nr:uncharacterized protein M409DRAFT_68903 [Zasmidium cellare ATCC 36951]KAF2162969.1 hypothetical protein M409DRAFT_68903 [Zasmidium cellare ATCC 36951]
MTSPETNPPFTPLPHEKVQIKPSTRVTLSLQTPSHYPARQQPPFSITHSNGTCYLTNQRIVYLPDKPTDKFKSFAAPILNLHDSYPHNPMFGASYWTASAQPVQGGGIPVPATGVVELKLTFKEGGAYDFHTTYEKLRERLQQVVDVSRMNGNGSGSSAGAMNGVDVSNVNLEDLPAYSEESDGPLIPPTAAAAAIAQAQAQQQRSPIVPQQTRDSGVRVDEDDNRPQPKPTDNALSPPDEPPPGYEETQMAGLQDELDRSLQHEQQR